MKNKITVSGRLSLIGSAVAVALALSGCESTAKPAAEMPEVTINAHTELLNETEKAFVSDARSLAIFGLTPDKMQVKLAEKSPEDAKKLVAAMMATLAERSYESIEQPASDTDENGIHEPMSIMADSGIIYLNPQAGGYNRGTVLQPALFDKYKREPGPFSLDRYLNEKGGIPTFADAPVAVRRADLEAGNVEVAFVGVPLALSSGWRDSKNAPTIMRGMYGLSGYNVAGGVDPSLVLNIADYGNISVDNMSPELNVEHVEEQLEDMIAAGTIPFIVGGDHSLMYPSVKAVTASYPDDAINVLHLDAHYRGERDLDHFYSDMQSVSNLIEQGVLPGSQLVQLGLRGASQDKEALTWLREQKVKYHTMAEVDSKGWAPVMESALTELKAGKGKTFISFDMSVVDPSEVSGANQPVAGGISVRQAMTTVRRACAETDVAGFELLGMAPYLDLTYNSALSANQIMHACLTGVAMRKEGINKTNYVDPMALSHGG